MNAIALVPDSLHLGRKSYQGEEIGRSAQNLWPPASSPDAYCVWQSRPIGARMLGL